MLSIHSSPVGKLGTTDTGGMSVYMLALATELGRRGIHVDIFTREVESGNGQPIEYADKVRIVCLDIDGTSGLLRSELLKHLYSFRQAIEAFAQNNEITYRLIHSNYWLSGIVGDQLKTLWHCPHVITFHTLAQAKVAAKKNHREDRQRLSEEARLLQCCDGVIAPTAHEKNNYKRVNAENTAPIYHVPLGVDLNHFKPGERCADAGLPGKIENPVVLFVGRFDPMKGAAIAIEALHLLKKAQAAQLVIIGGEDHASTEYQRLKQLMNDLGLRRRVHFEGTVEYRQIPEYYQRADVVVVPSFYESFGLVTLEALASGTPVAATQAGIAPEVIKNGINGYLATDTSSASVSAALARTLELAKSIDKEAIRQSIGEYSWSKVAGLTLDLYNEVLSDF